MSAYCCNPPISYRVEKNGKELVTSPNNYYYELTKDAVVVRLNTGCQYNNKNTQIYLSLYVINRTDTTIIVNTDNTDLIGGDIDFSLAQINVYGNNDPDVYQKSDKVGSFRDPATYRNHEILPGENLHFLLSYVGYSKEYVKQIRDDCKLAPATVSINKIYLRGKEINFNDYKITHPRNPRYYTRCIELQD